MFDDVIYTITSGNLEKNTWRCWAWFSSLKEAQHTIESCGDFFWENYYEVLVIEEIPRACITPEYREWWYKWDDSTWQATDKPKPVENLFHFGVG